MHKQAKDRWVEIKFYILCKKITKDFNNDTRVIQNIIQGLELYGGYKADIVKTACIQIITDMRCRPSKREIIILAHLSEQPLAPIIRTIKSCTVTAYKYINEHKENPIYIMPRLDKDKLNEIELFMKAYTNLKEVI